MTIINGTYWIQHCGCWFSFNEPAEVLFNSGGFYFASKHTGEQIHSIARNGSKNPS